MMPLCKNCPHPGTYHHWKVARLRGRCQNGDCRCIGYVPGVDTPKPVNKVIGRALYKNIRSIEPRAFLPYRVQRVRG